MGLAGLKSQAQWLALSQKVGLSDHIGKALGAQCIRQWRNRPLCKQIRFGHGQRRKSLGASALTV
jgi:hypothetical protein